DRAELPESPRPAEHHPCRQPGDRRGRRGGRAHRRRSGVRVMSEVIGAAAAILPPNTAPMIIAPRTPAEKGGAATQGAAESVKSTDLFRFWRFNDDGTEVADFVLN